MIAVMLLTDLFNPLSANITKWSNTLKHTPMNCLNVLDHFVGLVFKGLRAFSIKDQFSCFRTNCSLSKLLVSMSLITFIGLR